MLVADDHIYIYRISSFTGEAEIYIWEKQRHAHPTLSASRKIKAAGKMNLSTIIY